MATRSEQLLKQQQRPSVTETSALMNAHPEQTDSPQPCAQNKHSNSHNWYRLLRLSWWQSQGIPVTKSLQLLAQMAMSDKPRSSTLLDTVKDYQPGNWSYEWLSYAVEKQREQPSLKALTAASIASYPHFKGDALAAKAQVLVDRYYQQLIKGRESIGHFERITSNSTTFPRAGGYLHLPEADHAVPVVFVACDMFMLYTDLLVWYERFLASAGIGMFVVDFPGNGINRRWSWQQNSEQMYQQLWLQLKENPRVNARRVALFGSRWSVHGLLRMALLQGDEFPVLACIAPAVDAVFRDGARLAQLPQMVQDGLQNRLNIKYLSADELAGHLAAFSLKTQGLMKRNSWNGELYCIYHEEDLICDKQEAEILKQMAVNHEFVRFKGVSIDEQLPKVFRNCGKWLQKQLSYE